jgi:hypothetical protein
VTTFAYYCGLYFVPWFRPSNYDFGHIEGESTAGYTCNTPCVWSFACPCMDSRVQGISVLHLIQRTKQSNWS